MNEVTEFSLKSVAQNLALKREAAGWTFMSPIAELADQKVVESFLEGLAKEKFNKIAVEAPTIDWKAFGIDVPKVSIEVKSTKGQVYLFKVGSIKNFQGESFLQRDSENKVYVASANWSTWSEKKAFDFRDRRMMRLPTNTVSGLKIDQGARHLELQKKDDQWIAAGKVAWKLDQNKVREMVSLLDTTAAEDFLSEGLATSEQLHKLKLPQPQIALSVDHGDRNWKASIYSNKDRLYAAQVYEPAFLIRISEFAFKKFSEASLDALRDRQEPLNYNRSEVKKVQLTFDGASYEFIDQAGTWTWPKAVQGKSLNSEKLNHILSRLRNLSVATFLDIPDDPGIRKLKSKFVFRGADDKVMFELTLGEKRKLKLGGTETSVLVSKSSVMRNLFTLNESDFLDLKLAELMELNKSKANAEANTKANTKSTTESPETEAAEKSKK